MHNHVGLLCLLVVLSAGCGGSSGPDVEYVFVQSAESALLRGSRLNLYRSDEQTAWLTASADPRAGQIPSAEFVAQWSGGGDAPGDVRLNAELVCPIEGEVVIYDLELASPEYFPEVPGIFCEACPVIRYQARFLGDEVPPDGSVYCPGEADLFIAGGFLIAPGTSSADSVSPGSTSTR